MPHVERNAIRQLYLPSPNVYCHRGIIEFQPTVPKPSTYPQVDLNQLHAKKQEAILDMALERRQCDYFQSFSPGRDFQAHYDLYERARESKATRIWQIAGIIAVVVTNAAQLLLRAFRLIP